MRGLLRFHVFDALLNELEQDVRWTSRRGPAARVMAAVLEEADRLDGRTPRPRAEFGADEWRRWTEEFDFTGG